MSLCDNCKISPAKYECLLCNNCFCLRCDSYIHSYPSNRTHLRKYITFTNLIYNSYQLNPNLNCQNLNSNNEMQNDNQMQNNENILLYSQKNDMINEKEDYEFNTCVENNIYAKQIKCLDNEIMDTRENFENKIDALHEQFHIMNETQKQRMNELNEKNLREINMISSEKEIQIQRLKEILEEQNEIINQLKEENDNLIKIYNQNKKEIENVSKSKEIITKENAQLEEMNKKKIEDK